MKWQSKSPETLHTRTWGGEVVVYDEVSGNTHLLEQGAARVLAIIAQAPADTAELARALPDLWPAARRGQGSHGTGCHPCRACRHFPDRAGDTLKISALSHARLRQRLREDGLRIRTGPFVTRVQTSLAAAAEGIGLLYADYPLAGNDDFADFHIRLAPPAGVRRWLKPQVLFEFDGSPTFKPLPADQAFPMFEWGLNWCVSSHAHSYLIIHAAVLERQGHAVILPAPPGSGKSTLCAALAQRGWRLLSDELALVRIADGRIAALPRPVSLKNASIDIMRAYAPDAVFSRKISDTIKGTVAHMKAPADSIARANESARPGWLIFPRYEAGADTRLSEVSKAHAFMRAADNAFNYSTLGARGFACLADLVEAASCYDFTYSKLDEAIEAFNALRLQDPHS